MEKFLEPLSPSVLTNLEAGQLMRRLLSDLASIDPVLIVDGPYTVMVDRIRIAEELYEKALLQVRKNEETEKIQLADKVRDKALSAFRGMLDVFKSSDNALEVEAGRVLKNLLDTFENLARLNFEAESLGIDKLISELDEPAFKPKVELLHMERYVTRLKDTNDAFKTLFGGRMVTVAMTETYDLKIIRKDMLVKYTDFTQYVLAMSKAEVLPVFDIALNLINAARKYYADMYARRIATPEEVVDPVG